jgi:hypothetical protein
MLSNIKYKKKLNNDMVIIGRKCIKLFKQKINKLINYIHCFEDSNQRYC